MTLRIALVGKRERDKTAVTNYLRKKKNFQVKRLSDGAVRTIKHIYRYRLHQRVHFETQLKFYNAVYKIDPNVQIDYLIAKINLPGKGALRDKSPANVVVPDPRYINELERLRAEGFYVVRVSSPDPPGGNQIHGTSTNAAGSVKLHEYFGDKYSFDTISVDYSLVWEKYSPDGREKLRRSVDRMLEKLQEKA